MSKLDIINDVPIVAVTGGPCGGKDASRKVLLQKMKSKGIRPFFADEVATDIINRAVPRKDFEHFAKTDRRKYVELQGMIMSIQLEVERQTVNLARLYPDEKCVVIANRGVRDSGAYLTDDEFEMLLRHLGFSIYDSLEHYRAVCHMVTAADGAEEFYTLENNPARNESPAEAKALDYAIRRLWCGHSHYRLIDNSTNFDDKVDRLANHIAAVLGVPTPLETERKYLVAKMPDFKAAGVIHSDPIYIEQMYLPAPIDESRRIRMRQYINGERVFYETRKQDISSITRREEEQIINTQEYHWLSYKRDPKRSIVAKYRTCFLFNGQYFEFDNFKVSPRGMPDPLMLLEIELDSEGQMVNLPPFIEIVREVTNDPNYTNASIARALAA